MTDNGLAMVTDYLDGMLSEVEVDRLEKWLEADDAHVELFVREVYLHRQFRDVLLGDARLREKPGIADVARTTVESAIEVPLVLDVSSTVSDTRFWYQHPMRFLAVVTVVTLLVWAAFFGLFLSGTPNGNAPEIAAERPAGPVLARITGEHQVQWAESSAAPADGLLRRTTALELAAGLLEVTFDSGTTVVVEGPAVFHVAGKNALKVDHGRLAAKVSRKATGFSVITPQARIVDLGTEFGVAVDEAEGTGVHVFEGLVEARLTDTTETPRTEILMAGQSARIDTTTGQLQVTTGGTESLGRQFIRSVPNAAKRGVTKDLAVANWSFEVPDIRQHPEYRKVYDNLRRIPLGWHAPPMPSNDDVAKRRVLYQRTRHRVSANGVVSGPTDGDQVAMVSLRKSVSGSDTDILRTWLYQPLGVVTADDVGKTLRLSVDAAHFQFDDGAAVEAAFARGVSSHAGGDAVGTAGLMASLQRGQGVQTLRAALTIGPELIDRELSIRLTVAIPKSALQTDYRCQYHFDNVRCVIE